jgi:hypothetical protein
MTMENNQPKQGGPKTNEGKAVSRYNALKHGLLSKEVLLENEDTEAFAEFSEALSEELKPVGPFEETLVDRIISCYWRLRRAVYVEKNTMDWYETDREAFVMVTETEEQIKRKNIKNILANESIENILRYETTIERSLFRALHELERLQAKRNGKDIPIPAVLDVNMDSSFGKNTL